MKIIKTLFFILMALNLNAQSETPKYEPRPWYVQPQADFQLALGVTNHETYNYDETYTAGVLIGAGFRFRNHFYTSINYLLAGNIILPHKPIFSSENEVIQNLSLVTGVHHTNKYFYAAIGGGVSRLTGNYWDNKSVSYHSFKKFGLEFKTEMAFTFNKYTSYGFSYNYNVNSFKNFSYTMLTFHFNLLP